MVSSLCFANIFSLLPAVLKQVTFDILHASLLLDQSALEHFSDKEYKFLVFSDDIEWCKQVFDDDFNFIEGEEDYVDLLLMARCKHNIIANSSFSWWGAWLNRNNNKRVIAPKKWFGSVANLDSKDLLPKGWITL